MNVLAENLKRVERNIKDACERSGRSIEDVTLIAVSKRKPASLIREAYALGLRDFGENYAQELAEKAQELSDLKDIRWHMIGHVQRNKVNLVVKHTSVLHTVDSDKLASALAARVTQPLPVFISVNLGQEASKSGCAVSELPALVEKVREQQSLSLLGLMAIPPRAEAPEQARPHFERLRQLAEQHQLKGLSMGMSADYMVAVEEGATHVRVGTSLFGARE